MNSPAYLIGKMSQRVSYNVGRVMKEAGLAMDRFGSRLSNDVAHMQELSRHRQIMPLYDIAPTVDQAWVAPNASLIGEVLVSKYATVWYNVVIRAELNPVRIGHFSSIGDGTTINTACALPHGLAASVNIGKNVTVEPHCSLYSCIIDDDVYIGRGSVIMQGARIERGAHILPGTVVPPGRLIPAGQVWGGNPAKFVRNLTQDELLANYSKSYTNAATEFSDADSKFPHSYQVGDLKEGQQSIGDYAEQKYFKNI
jgi:carbonic anhydrase/acetyltransferase-like protein (isoleucine patch superfamily)